jgi:SWI/SNF-related matrix-associated actin-dependent regulator of chromatin subfamily A member 5
MPKEDRSNWVAVEPEFQKKSDSQAAVEIRKATSAYQYFQKDVSATVKEEIVQQYGSFDIAKHGRIVRDRWNALSDTEKEPYYQLQRTDQARFAQESHLADIAALERKQRLRQEREAVLLDDEGGMSRTTRRKWDKKQRKKVKNEQKLQKTKKFKADDGDFVDEEDDESVVSWNSDLENDDSDSSEEKRKKMKARQPPRQLTQKQIEHRTKLKQEKAEKESYIADRQQDLRKERADQAKRRLEFLLKQSNIFSHFGGVKEDAAKFGTRIANHVTSPRSPDGHGGSRRGAAEDEDEEVALAEADEHEATFLTQQPTTLGFGQMRDYQLEGLNWMIRLQENGVNGILADGTSLQAVVISCSPDFILTLIRFCIKCTEMGLGKTLQSISILVYMLEYKNVSGPHLIVVPKSTLSNWMNELARWAPTLNSVKFHGDKATREDIISTILEPGQRDEDRDWHVVVTTYEICNLEKNTLNKFAWSYLIIDEAHRLKNEASTFSKTVRQFETRYRILLTGTPLQNSLHELWALLNFLVPDVFASSEQFDEWFNLDIDDADEKNKLISQLHKILRPFMLRRLKADVEKSLVCVCDFCFTPVIIDCTISISLCVRYFRG